MSLPAIVHCPPPPPAVPRDQYMTRGLRLALVGPALRERFAFPDAQLVMPLADPEEFEIDLAVLGLPPLRCSKTPAPVTA